MLTKTQSDLLRFIVDFQDENGFSPSHSEMVEALGLNSKSEVNRKLIRLRERGFVSWQPCLPRSVRVLKRPAVLRTVFIPLVDGRIDPANAQEISITRTPHG